MEKLEVQKNKHGSIIFYVVLLNGVFAVFVLAGMAYMLTRITQQEHEITNLKTMLRQLHPHIKIKAGMTAEDTNKRQGFQVSKIKSETKGQWQKVSDVCMILAVKTSYNYIFVVLLVSAIVNQNKQNPQKTEFAEQDENEEEKPKISRTRRQRLRTTRSICCGEKIIDNNYFVIFI